MDKIAIEYAARALDQKISRMTEYVNHNKDLAKRMEREIKNKKCEVETVGGFGVSMEYHESTSQKILKNANNIVENSEPHLKNYIHAREEIKKEFGV
jgi:hypothetical protein